jgi:hypothetical protein
MLSSSDTVVNTVLDLKELPCEWKYAVSTISDMIIGIAVSSAVDSALAYAKLRMDFSSMLRSAVSL